MQRMIEAGDLFDSACTDPPYHLISIVERFGSEDAAPAQVGQTGAYARQSAGFMGQEWDGSNEDGRCIAFEVETWRLVYQLLKPGAHLVAFGHTKTKHRMVCAIEDAGFEIRDELAWTYATGFPKSRDVAADIAELLGVPVESIDWEDWRTALKPAWEGICLARKPLSEPSVAQNMLRWGTGALNIGACRIPFADAADEGESKRKNQHGAFENGQRRNHIYQADNRDREDYDAAGRWPANLIHDGSPEVVALFPKTAPARRGKPRQGRAGEGWAMTHTGAEYSDNGGSAARFFFQAKADKYDRVNRCKKCGARSILSEPHCHPDEKGEPQIIRHPTVKPLDLMRWIVRLVTPPGGRVLDCFAGTGSTGIAADREGMSSVLIEQSEDYVGDIHYRLAELSGANTPLFGGGAA